VAAALGDPTARVVFGRTGRTWVDYDGAAVVVGGPGRAVTLVERDGAPFAAVEHDAALDDRPAAVELSVAAAGASIEFERLEALANARRDEAWRARRAIVEVQDRARQRLERDLHDGAQQRLVALALQASLAAHSGDCDVVVDELAAGVTAARRELHDVAAGLLPGLLIDRGLAASLTALAATAPMPVDVRVHDRENVRPEVLVAAWFVVAEAVANAIKHSGATHVTVTGDVDRGRLDMEVVDDGCGGADPETGTGLIGLRDRVVGTGGLLSIDSPAGGGTRVRAEFPLQVVT
jgi:signal transduction histidine kinase